MSDIDELAQRVVGRDKQLTAEKNLEWYLERLPSTRVKLRNTAAGWFCQYQKKGGGAKMVESHTSDNHIIHRTEWVEFGDTPLAAAKALYTNLISENVIKEQEN